MLFGMLSKYAHTHPYKHTHTFYLYKYLRKIESAYLKINEVTTDATLS